VRAASRIASGLAVGAGVIVYAALAHLSNAAPGNQALGAMLAIGPLWFVAVILAWRSTYRVPALLACGVAALLVDVYWRDLEAHFAWFYLLQQAGTYGLLGVSFGRSLVGRRVPLCTRFAAIIDGAVPPAVARYTRSVTIAWTLFFAALTTALIVIYLLAPLAVWSVFANFCTTPIVALMFVAEYLVRRRVLPQLPHRGVLATVQAVSSGAVAPFHRA
jgi:uncharacterized membrane protein